MMLEATEIHFGVTAPGDLNPEKPIIYCSESTFTQDDPRGMRALSTLPVPKEVAAKLRKFDGKFTFSTPSKDKTSKTVCFHLYAQDTTTIDGLNRLCYVQYAEDRLKISECFSARGAHYSALYSLLCARMEAFGFTGQGTYIIAKDEIDRFVEAANQLLADKAADKYLLQPVLEVDAISISNRKYYYYKARWVPKEDVSVPEAAPQAPELADLSQRLQQIQQLIGGIARSAQDIRVLEPLQTLSAQVEALHGDIDTCSNAIRSLIQYQEIVDALS